MALCDGSVRGGGTATGAVGGVASTAGGGGGGSGMRGGGGLVPDGAAAVDVFAAAVVVLGSACTGVEATGGDGCAVRDAVILCLQITQTFASSKSRFRKSDEPTASTLHEAQIVFPQLLHKCRLLNKENFVRRHTSQI